MTQTEQAILNALVELEDAIQKIRTADSKPDLLPIFSRIDELTGQLPPGGNSELLHYLHKKSYEKARLHLQGRQAENSPGKCRQ